MLTTDFGTALTILGGMLARMADMQPALKRIGQQKASDIQDNILHGKHTPDGDAWSPWTHYTRSEREHKGNVSQGLLWDTGALVNSIHAQSHAGSVSIGTDVAYGPDLQYGRSGHQAMDARPFLGWAPSDLPMVSHMLALYIETGVAP